MSTAERAIDESHWYRAATSWGDAAIRWNGRAVTGVRPPVAGDESTVDLVHDTPELLLPIADAPAPVRELAARIAAYVDHEPGTELVDRTTLQAWLDEAGISGFRARVMLELASVPAGVTISYGELAELAGRPRAARAAGSTCAANPLPLLVPCHRVLHAGARPGDVGSYGAATGSAYKRRLLEHERAAHVLQPA